MIAMNPNFNWMRYGGNALQDIGVGLTQSPTVFGGLARGAQLNQANQPYRDQQATLEEERKREALEKNQTTDWIKANFPQYANLPAAQGFQLAMGELQAQRNAASGGSDLPANIQEWNTYSQMTPAQKAEYIRMKRANPYLDLGTGFGQPDPINPGSLAGPVIPKNGDIPTGFEQNPAGGGITPMPGGPQAVERNMDLLKATERAKAVDSRSDIVINAIDKATGQSHWATTGPIGSAGRFFGVTQAVDLEGTINTIKANIGFNELQAMREASPTGGALGQVAVQELEMLQSVIASLDPRQGEAQLDENLKTIKTLLERQKMFRQQALEERSAVIGGGAPAGGGTTYTYNPATGNLE